MAYFKRQVTYAPWDARKEATYQSVNETINGKYIDGYGRFDFYVNTDRNHSPRPVVLYEEDGNTVYVAYDDVGDAPVLIYRTMEV